MCECCISSNAMTLERVISVGDGAVEGVGGGVGEDRAVQERIRRQLKNRLW